MPLRRTGGLAICVGAMLAIVAPQPVGALPDAGLVNVAGAAGVAETTVAYHVSVDDYDRDGRRGLPAQPRWKVPMRLYRNTGRGRFVEDLRTDFGIEDRLDCEWGDPNVDGRPDLYCSVGAHTGRRRRGTSSGSSRADGTFVDRAAAWKVTDPYGRGRQVAFFNLNGDRYPDLFVGNDYPRQDGSPHPTGCSSTVAARATAKSSSPA